jgi:very-short-patch-repair endonuclease
MRKDLVQGRAIVALAERQHGVVTRAQLAEIGLTDPSVGRRVENGSLWRVHKGLYAVGRPSLTREGRFMAAVLSCGPAAALSHFAAAVVWGLIRERGPRIDVTVPRGGQRRRRGAVIIHRSALPDTDVTLNDGIRVTTPARTLIDLADVLPRRRLERAFDEAAYLRLDLAPVSPRPGRRGAGVLAQVIAMHAPGSTRTRSELEELMLGLCDRFRLPTPEVNVTIHDYEVDFLWRDSRLIVEVDGWAAHGTRGAFERDRRRDADLLAAGWRVLRISWERLRSEPLWVAERLAEALAS